MAESKSVIKLTNDNYKIWRVLIEAIFTCKNVHNVAVGLTPCPLTGPNSKGVKK